MCTSTMTAGSLALRPLGVDVVIRSHDAAVQALLATHYGRMRAALGLPALAYTIVRTRDGWLVSRNAVAAFCAAEPGELLLRLDQDVIIQLQTRRPDLYFLHAAVLEVAGRAVMLVAPSGGGKSTTTWALVHHGFRYLSDELGPLELATLTVSPFPRALSLKAPPPPAYPLPASALRTSRGFHIGAEAMWSGVRDAPARLAGIFFLRYAGRAAGPSVCAITAAEAAARLYANALNALAHPADGLDAAVRVARGAACFDLTTADLRPTCALVVSTARGLG
jgi:hypothetical protein